jgi:hypothetical protein
MKRREFVTAVIPTNPTPREIFVSEEIKKYLANLSVAEKRALLGL